MANKKRKWSEWCHDYVRKSGKCPGETPAFGLPEASMTSEEFEQTMAVADLHTWTGNCHFGVKPDEVDPVNGPPVGMKKLVVKEGASNGLGDAKEMAAHLGEVMDSQRIISIKKNLHNYVERISLKENGQLVIPAPLLDIKGYVGKYFEIE
jgi:hypothetical protein